MKIETIKEKIKEKELEINALKDKMYEQLYKKEKEYQKTIKWIYIKELDIEIQNKIHDKGECFQTLIYEYGLAYLSKNLPTFKQLEELRSLELKGKYKLNLINTNEFVKGDVKDIHKFYGSGEDNVWVFYSNSEKYFNSCLTLNEESDKGLRFVRRRKK